MSEMGEHLNASTGLSVGAVMNPALAEQLHVGTVYKVECFDKDGKLKWAEEFHNTVVTVGKNDLLDNYLAGSAYTAAFFLGLKGTGTVAAADTLASHSGWSEVTPYSGNRPALSWSSASSGSKAASAATAYTINATATVAGAFIATVNTGTSGILFSAGDFSASRSVASGDTLNVTPTVSV